VNRYQEALQAALTAAVESGEWKRLPGTVGTTVRHSTAHRTPEWALRPGRFGAGAAWPSEEYERHVFVTVVTGLRWAVILGTSAAPWSRRLDRRVSMRRAVEILADPASAFNEKPPPRL
jgi:hypothetical protein